MTSSEQIDDRKNRLEAGSVPAFDVTKMLTSMFELGAGVLRTQQQLFASLVPATKSNSRDANDRETDGGRGINSQDTSGRGSASGAKGDRNPSDTRTSYSDSSGRKSGLRNVAHGNSDQSAPPDAWQLDASGSDVDKRVSAERESGIALRAEEISHSPEAGSDFDNWIRAEWEGTIAARAEKISRCRPVGGDVENWLQAEREIQRQRELIAARAREVAAASPLARGDLDNWLQAERELRAAGRIGDK